MPKQLDLYMADLQALGFRFGKCYTVMPCRESDPLQCAPHGHLRQGRKAFRI